MLSSSSHIAAKAANALPLSRLSNWSCMPVTANGPDHLANPKRRGTTAKARVV